MSRFFDLLVANEIYADIDFIMSPQEDGKTENFYLEGTLSSLTVDWGDGTQATAQGTNSHTYTSAGDYRVRVLGDCRTVTRFACTLTWIGTETDVTKVNRMQLPNATSWAYAFFNSRITTLPIGFSCYNATNTEQMFYECNSLASLPSSFTCPNTTNVDNMFRRCSSLTSIPSGFSCPNATNTQQLFYDCNSLTSIPSGLRFTKTTNVLYMFCRCRNLVWTPTASDFWERQSPQLQYNGCTFAECGSMPNFASIPIAWQDYGTTILYQPPNE